MTDNISIEEGVVCGTRGSRDLRCDIYTPAGASNAPAVLVLYGGGWRMGERSRVREACLSLARRGFVAIAGEYRLTPEAAWPAQIHDVKATIRWIRANAARLNINPAKIAAQGHSAGAHLAMLAAGTPNMPEFEGEGGNPGISTELAAVVGIYPPVVFQPGEEKVSGSVPANALMGSAATEELARAASPITYASASYPPAFMLHGTADKVVPVSATLRMYEALTAVRAHVEMHIYTDLPHGFARVGSIQDQLQEEIASFLRRTMVEPEAFKRELEVFAAQALAARQQVPLPA
ncbi:MAG: alpha/beta hydrolase fold domain-containing protein [Dehalococcoidia bacterium]